MNTIKYKKHIVHKMHKMTRKKWVSLSVTKITREWTNLLKDRVLQERITFFIKGFVMIHLNIKPDRIWNQLKMCLWRICAGISRQDELRKKTSLRVESPLPQGAQIEKDPMSKQHCFVVVAAAAIAAASAANKIRLQPLQPSIWTEGLLLSRVVFRSSVLD